MPKVNAENSGSGDHYTSENDAACPYGIRRSPHNFFSFQSDACPSFVTVVASNSAYPFTLITKEIHFASCLGVKINILERHTGTVEIQGAFGSILVCRMAA